MMLLLRNRNNKLAMMANNSATSTEDGECGIKEIRIDQQGWVGQSGN